MAGMYPDRERRRQKLKETYQIPEGNCEICSVAVLAGSARRKLCASEVAIGSVKSGTVATSMSEMSNPVRVEHHSNAEMSSDGEMVVGWTKGGTGKASFEMLNSAVVECPSIETSKQAGSREKGCESTAMSKEKTSDPVVVDFPTEESEERGNDCSIGELTLSDRKKLSASEVNLNDTFIASLMNESHERDQLMEHRDDDSTDTKLVSEIGTELVFGHDVRGPLKLVKEEDGDDEEEVYTEDEDREKIGRETEDGDSREKDSKENEDREEAKKAKEYAEEFEKKGIG